MRSPAVLTKIVRRWPFLCLYGMVVLSNVAGSAFSFMYNTMLIVNRLLDEDQTKAFWDVASPLYNVLAYPICVAVMMIIFQPLRRCWFALAENQPISEEELESCRKRLVNLPFYQVLVNLGGWIPGAVFFPFVICYAGGMANAGSIWLQFGVSFFVSALFTTAQTFFLFEAYLMKVLYPIFFQDARPAQIRGVIRIPFGLRLLILWLAVAVMPLIALLTVALNFNDPNMAGFAFKDVSLDQLLGLALVVSFLGVVSGGAIFRIVGSDLLSWVKQHSAATEQIAMENFDIRIEEKRPDAFGILSDHFNDMAAALGMAKYARETMGEFMHPEVRDEVLKRFPGVQADAQEITVVFVDIRGFSRRCARETPEAIGILLNRFMTLALQSIEEKGGLVNKFLGDGVMALFGALRQNEDHADMAVASASDLVERVAELNVQLVLENQEPLAIGIGIHTGVAVVGCFGSHERRRREFSAIGETVNLSQRLEQLTKECGGPILLSEQTMKHMRRPVPLDLIGPKRVAGFPQPVVVHRVVSV